MQSHALTESLLSKQSPITALTLNTIPNDHKKTILEFLPFEDQLRIRKVNTSFNTFGKNLPREKELEFIDHLVKHSIPTLILRNQDNLRNESWEFEIKSIEKEHVLLHSNESEQYKLSSSIMVFELDKEVEDIKNNVKSIQTLLNQYKFSWRSFVFCSGSDGYYQPPPAANICLCCNASFCLQTCRNPSKCLRPSVVQYIAAGICNFAWPGGGFFSSCLSCGVMTSCIGCTSKVRHEYNLRQVETAFNDLAITKIVKRLTFLEERRAAILSEKQTADPNNAVLAMAPRLYGTVTL